MLSHPKRIATSVFLLCFPVLAVPTCAVPTCAADVELQFARDIFPLFSKHCLACHGPDEEHRMAGLRLDLEAGVTGDAESDATIVPGQKDESELWHRMTTADPDRVMPPLVTEEGIAIDDRPTQHEIEVIGKWISAGAPWGKHWSFEPPLARADQSALNGQHPIDFLVARELALHNVSPGPPAIPQLLVRRLWLDLVGLPPTPEIADQFARNPTPEAYQTMVDDLLARSEFGEHWGRMWLDLARYADTKGYEKDLGRTVWPYRDWVVQAFNSDMRLPEFTEKQLAGDLLPNASMNDILATAYHRNTMSNDEGGTDDEEFRVAAVKDRVDSTVQVWMGLTMGCAKCHTHKYDPISIDEYYQFYAMFNQTEDADRYDDEPKLQVISELHQSKKEELESLVANARQNLESAAKIAFDSPSSSSDSWFVPTSLSGITQSGIELRLESDGSLAAFGSETEKDTYLLHFTLPSGTHHGLRIEALAAPRTDGSIGVGRSLKDPNFVLSEIEFTAETLAPDALSSEAPIGQHKIALVRPRADFSQQSWPVENSIDGNLDSGWAVSPQGGQRHAAIYAFEAPLTTDEPTSYSLRLVQNYGGGLVLNRFRVTFSNVDTTNLDPLADPPAVAAARNQLATAEQTLRDFVSSLPAVPIMKELVVDRKRETRVHERGNFLAPGDKVAPEFPASLFPVADDLPRNRQGVAQWLTNENNPLTARVWANRVWARIFGLGLVETEEDFGALGAYPSQPELLDQLAVEYQSNDWSLKHLIKFIVTSRTYQQSSAVSEAQYKDDPKNLWLARSNRYRLAGEVIRDCTLETAGLLSHKLGGPPVMPPQPDGLWRSTYSGLQWVNAEGEDRWRRGIYTFWKRTTPYPSMITFDAGSREVCQIRRIVTNTPLQALVTMNDTVYVEAAAALAGQMINHASDDAGRVERGLRLVLIRPLDASELEPLIRLKQDLTTTFTEDVDNARQWIQAARAQQPEGISDAEFAAWIAVANVMLNLDEFLTRS